MCVHIYKDGKWNVCPLFLLYSQISWLWTTCQAYFLKVKIQPIYLKNKLALCELSFFPPSPWIWDLTPWWLSDHKIQETSFVCQCARTWLVWASPVLRPQLVLEEKPTVGTSGFCPQDCSWSRNQFRSSLLFFLQWNIYHHLMSLIPR